MSDEDSDEDNMVVDSGDEVRSTFYHGPTGYRIVHKMRPRLLLKTHTCSHPFKQHVPHAGELHGHLYCNAMHPHMCL